MIGGVVTLLNRSGRELPRGGGRCRNATAPRRTAANSSTVEGFEHVEGGDETGTVVWPGGADLSPDTLYVRARTGSWPDHDIDA
jgi:hypothetical protein